MRLGTIMLAAATSVAACSVASAAPVIVTEITPPAYPAGVPDGARTFDLQMVVNEGIFASAGLVAELSSGGFYNTASFGEGAAGRYAQQSIWGLLPALEFDTFLAVPDGSGGLAASSLTAGYTDGTLPAVVGGTVIDGVASVPVPPPAGLGTGIFTFARLTLLPGSTGTISGEASTTFDVAPDLFSLSIENGVVVIPEPASMSLLGLAAMGLVRRRR